MNFGNKLIDAGRDWRVEGVPLSQTDRQRDPYGKVVDNFPRRNVHFGTVNEGGYLKDPTGGRRFWPLRVLKTIDVARIAADRDQLWAEAAALEAEGAADVLPAELWGLAAERQADETSDDPWADVIRAFLEQRAWSRTIRIPSEDEDSDFLPDLPPDRVHSIELFEHLEIKKDQQTRDKAQRLRTVMEAGLGWSHRKAVRISGRFRRIHKKLIVVHVVFAPDKHNRKTFLNSIVLFMLCLLCLLILRDT